MFKHMVVALGTLVLAAPACAAAPPGALARELMAAIKTADDALRTAPIKMGVATVVELRLPPHAKLELCDLRNSYYRSTGLREATAIFAKAKAALDHAIKLHRKIDGSVAATFLGRYAWFRADYATQCHALNAAYPRKRFRKLVLEALGFDPKNSQALLMRAFLDYSIHSHPWAKPMPGRPGSFEAAGIRFSAKSRKSITDIIKAVLQTHPHEFTAWLLLGRIDRGNPANWIGMLRSAKNADPFYFGFNRRNLAIYIKWCQDHLMRYPKLYEKYYGHPPQGKKSAQTLATTQPNH